jgi:hypothetical protein
LNPTFEAPKGLCALKKKASSINWQKIIVLLNTMFKIISLL